jgi:hypothetical protein
MNSPYGGYMNAEDVNWKGYEVRTPEATWVCVESKCIESLGDRIDYDMEFSARGPSMTGTPDSRKLLLRTSAFKVCEEGGFLGFLKLVVEGQLLETIPWDRFIEVYGRD